MCVTRVVRFDQVIDVSDADRALALANIEKAANLLRHQPRGNVMARLRRSFSKDQKRGRPTEEVMAKVKWKFQPIKTKLEKETEYDGHKRSHRSL